MRKKLVLGKYPLLVLTLAFSTGSQLAFAQQDSGYIDLGRVQLSSPFTQEITIPGSDLEKIPFSSLSEAINVYLYGAYTHNQQLVYIIDGNLVNDADAYSICDIESVTVVQNALTYLNGAPGGKQLVLIKTRNGNGQAPGITVAGGSYLVSRRESEKNKPVESITAPDFFHQYTISAQARKGRSVFGGSVNWLRKVGPVEEANAIIDADPYRLDRFRLNAWFATRVGKRGRLSVNMNAAPQRDKNAFETSFLFGPNNNEAIVHQQASGKRSILNPGVQLYTPFSRNWSNRFSASINWARHSVGQYTTREMPTSTGPGLYPSSGEQTTLLKERLLIIRDDIRYEYRWKDWQIAPSLNLSWLQSNFRSIETEETRIEDPGNLSPQTSYSRSEESLRGGVLLATPSVSLGYKDYFSLQGGVQLNTNLKTPSLTANGHNKVSVRPFISAGANLLKMIRPESSTALILFGSLANSAYQGEIIPSFSDLDFSQEPGTSMEYVHPYDALAAQKSIDAWQVGLRLQLFGDRIRIDYNFENNRVAMLRQISVYPNPSVFLTEEIELVQKVHRIRISANAVNTDHFSWRMGVNTASNKSKLILPAQNTGGNPTPSVNPFDSKREWTGGFWNHFRYKKLVAGLNILYHFNDTYYKQTSTMPPLRLRENTNNFDLQHIYLGYQLPVKKLALCEIYASGRNLLQSNKLTPEIGGLRYYGLGAKVAW